MERTSEIKYADIICQQIDFTNGANDIITVICPYCRCTHKHRSAALVERDARCGAGKYTPRVLEGPK